MLTITKTETTTRSLDTPEAIADHVHAEFERRTATAPFQPGDRVRLTSREGLPAEYLVGDVATVMLCDPEFSPLTTVMGVSAAGLTIQFPVQTANLALTKA